MVAVGNCAHARGLAPFEQGVAFPEATAGLFVGVLQQRVGGFEVAGRFDLLRQRSEQPRSHLFIRFAIAVQRRKRLHFLVEAVLAAFVESTFAQQPFDTRNLRVYERIVRNGRSVYRRRAEPQRERSERDSDCKRSDVPGTRTGRSQQARR